MAEKLVKVKNVSRNDFGLSLSFVTEGKFLDLKPDTVVPLTSDEYMYLVTQCPGAFKKGFLSIVEIDDSLADEKIESKNVMSNDDIVKLLDLTIAKFKKEISVVDSSILLKDIRLKAVELNKSDKFVAEIDAQIGSVSDGSILI